MSPMHKNHAKHVAKWRAKMRAQKRCIQCGARDKRPVSKRGSVCNQCAVKMYAGVQRHRQRQQEKAAKKAL